MKSSPNLVALAALSLVGYTAFSVTVNARPVLWARGKADIASAILSWISALIPDSTFNAWDYNNLNYMCAINMETSNGGNCKSSVTCAGGYHKDYNDWNVCYVGGRQFFKDDQIGPFSITFKEKDGEGEGLTTPILQLEYVNNWMEFPVRDLANKYRESEDCHDHNGIYCDNGPFICNAPWEQRTQTTKEWECGMPVTGKGKSDVGLDSNGPVNAAGYRPGECGIHVKQFQKPDPSKDSYKLEITLFDANQNEIGKTNGPQDAPAGVGVEAKGKLPLVMIATTQNVDADPVKFAYGGEIWDSASKQCSVGAYDSGVRQMDCGFTCN